MCCRRPLSRHTHHGVTDNKTARVKKEDLNNENALKVVSARLTNTINTSAVKHKYLLVFAEVIEPLQIEKLYRIDDRIAKEARRWHNTPNSSKTGAKNSRANTSPYFFSLQRSGI